MMKWLYPEVIDNLKIQCNSFLNNEIEIEDIQSHIYLAEQQIVAIDEQWLRTLLFNIENEIELNLYTIDRSDLPQIVKPIIEQLLEKIS
ncbi:hypothetical protein AB7281_21055 [Providencia rettgeri]